MKTLKCDTCGHEDTRNYTACSKCGAEYPGRRKARNAVFGIAICVCVVAYIAFTVVGAHKDKDKPTKNDLNVVRPELSTEIDESLTLMLQNNQKLNSLTETPEAYVDFYYNTWKLEITRFNTLFKKAEKLGLLEPPWILPEGKKYLENVYKSNNKTLLVLEPDMKDIRRDVNRQRRRSTVTPEKTAKQYEKELADIIIGDEKNIDTYTTLRNNAVDERSYRRYDGLRNEALRNHRFWNDAKKTHETLQNK